MQEASCIARDDGLVNLDSVSSSTPHEDAAEFVVFGSRYKAVTFDCVDVGSERKESECVCVFLAE